MRIRNAAEKPAVSLLRGFMRGGVSSGRAISRSHMGSKGWISFDKRSARALICTPLTPFASPA